MRILAVDDDPVMRRILQATFTQAGHDVTLAADGRQAWAILRSDPHRLVITDWMMPEMDGPALIRAIRSSPFPGYVYVILLTAKNSREDVVQGLDAGADDYIIKPFANQELRARVNIGERVLKLEDDLLATQRRLEVLASRDSLTGLLARQTLQEHAEAELSRARREGKAVSLILFDLDHFKQVNDQHGHLVGDQVLREVAHVLEQRKRSYDWAGRWGGEEFLLVLPGADTAAACAVAERIRDAVACAPVRLPGGDPLTVRISAGVASTDAAAPRSFEDLLQDADRALYAAKRGGRNRIRAHPAAASQPA